MDDQMDLAGRLKFENLVSDELKSSFI